MDAKYSQGLKTTFIIHFIVALLFGLGFLFIPATVGSWYGMTVQEPETYRLLGAALLGLAVSSLLAYSAQTWESVRIVVIMEIVWTILGTLVALYAIFFMSYPALWWINAIILAAFAVAFSWFYFRK